MTDQERKQTCAMCNATMFSDTREKAEGVMRCPGGCHLPVEQRKEWAREFFQWRQDQKKAVGS